MRLDGLDGDDWGVFVNRCEFEHVGSLGKLHRYRCRVCGRMTAWLAVADPSRVLAICDTPQAGDVCQYRQPGETIPGDRLDCGCRSLTLYTCGQTGELVTLRTMLAEHSRVLEGQISLYRGQSCETCRLPRSAAESG